MTEDEKQIAIAFAEHHLSFWKDDPNRYKYLQIKLLGGSRRDVEKAIALIDKTFGGSSKSKLHRCSVDFDPEIRCTHSHTLCHRCFLKVYLPPKNEDPFTVQEETITALRQEIRDLEGRIAQLYSRLEAMKSHRRM